MFSAARVDGATLRLTFNETLGPAASLANGAFTVKKTPQGGSQQNVSLTGSPTISGATITLTLASEVLKTDTDVKVSYTKPTSGTGNRLVDAVGNEVVSFSDKAVANETGAPVLTTLALDADDGRRLTLTFDQGLAVPSAEQVRRLRHAISILGARHQGAALDEQYPNTIAVSGATVTLTFGAEVLPGHTATVTYNPVAARDAALTDLDGNKVAGFADRAVTRPAGGAAVAPSLTAARVAGTGLTLTFDRALDAGSAPAGRRFEVRHQMHSDGGLGPQLVARGTGTASVSGQTVSVTLDSAVPQDAHAWVYYLKGDDASPLRGASNGPEAVDIWGYSGVSDRTAPELTRAVVTGTKLVLYYGEALDTGSMPAAGDYTVTAGTTAQTVSTVSIGAGAVTLTLSASVAASAAVTVDYAAGTNPVQDVAGNNAENLSGETVTNLGPTNTTAPELAATDAAVLADRTLTLAWTLPLDPARVPDKSAFTVNGSRFEVVDSVAVRDRKVELGL
ncbi:MAG: SwmB domain-containing protein, partial [Acidobacteria bacterium]|nr:SwmB domain-containing protein [Acidobacteriota bacterium]